ncbi:MAG TPA: hypothetical protein VM890_10185 [Longimicrobium sp.]|nr:hypothetical protein [Longimicrobium sp.]
MRTRPAPLLAALLALGACRDLPTTPGRAEPAPASRERTPLRCSVAIATRSVACAAPVGPRGMRGNVILGGQGLNVRLVSTNVAYDGGDRVFSFDVTVQNLLDQPMGTDGTTPSGVRVFFSSGPSATSGSGTVTVLTDSVGTFLAANQRYYKYDGAIQPRGVSQPQRWEFSVASGVNAFEFLVYVEAQLPGESGIFHWRPEQGTQLYLSDIRGVWAASAHDVFAVSDGAVLHFDGNYWRAMDAGGCGCEDALYGVWGSSGTNVYAVGLAGSVLHWTGEEWTAESDPDIGSDNLYAVWGTSAGNVWAVGDFGRIVHFDGADWTTVAANPVSAEPLTSVWGNAANSVWAVGEAGTILHWDGTSWTPQSLPDPVTLTAVWGTSATDVWAAGADDGCGCGGDGVLYHYDGTAWTAVTGAPDLTGQPLSAGWSSGPTDVWIAGFGVVLHYDGDDWTQEGVGSGAPLYGITGTSATNVFAVGSLATIARNAGSGWETLSLPESDVHGLWGSSASDVWAVAGPVIRHRTGGAWAWDVAPDGLSLNAVWGSGAADVWAVGDLGGVAHYDGADWSSVTVAGVFEALNAVWGASAGDVWAAGGDGRVLHWNGSAWTAATVGTGGWFGLWGSGSSDVFVVGDGGAIQRWNGAAWAPMNSGTSEYLIGVWGSGPGDVYAVGDNGTVLHYDGNAGGDWTAVSTPADPSGPVNGVWGSGPDDVYLLANAGLDLVHWDGTAWRTVSSFSRNGDIWMYAIWGTGSRNVYTGGDLGTILHGQR